MDARGEVKNFNLKAIFIAHFVLMAWGSEGSWTSDSYLFTNLVFFSVLLWCLVSENNSEAIQLAIIIDVVCILLDVVMISSRYPESSHAVSNKFSGWMAIINLILRPFTAYQLWKLLEQQSGGSLGPRSHYGTAVPSQYQNIDAPAGAAQA